MKRLRYRRVEINYRYRAKDGWRYVGFIPNKQRGTDSKVEINIQEVKKSMVYKADSIFLFF